MSERQLRLVASEDGDPRAALDDDQLAAASRNAFPVVSTRVARTDNLGLAAGAACALLLGGMTFWSLHGHRQAAPNAASTTGAPAVPAEAEATAPALPEPSPVVAAPGAAASPASPFTSYVPAPAAQPYVPPADVAAAGPQANVKEGSAPAPGPSALQHGWSSILIMDTGAGTAPSVTGSEAKEGGEGAIQAALGSADGGGATPMANPSSLVVQGTLIPAVLETAINSDLPGYARAVVTRDVRSFDGSRVLIPRSSRLIGEYKSGLADGQTRAYVMWSRLVRPDGVSITIASPTTDALGRTGLTGQVDTHFMKRFGSAILLSIIGAASTVGSGGGVVVVAGAQSAAAVAAQQNGQIPPTIRVRPGQPLRVFTAHDLDFSTVTDGSSGR